MKGNGKGVEPDEEFDFGSDEEVQGGFAKEAESVHGAATKEKSQS